MASALSKICVLCAVIMAANFTGMNSISYADPRQKELPFYPGEKLVFQVEWEFITAGEAVLEILPVEEIDGVKAYHYVMRIKTSPFLDIFHKVRDRIESFTDIHMDHALMYRKQKMGGKKKDIRVTFDWENGEAQYSNSGKKRRPIRLEPGAFDPLSIFYAFRCLDLEVGRTHEIPITDGKRCVTGRLTVLKREKIKIDDNIFDTYLVEPDLEHIGGVFEKSKGARIRIWVTADKRRIPVRFKSKVALGSFVAELKAVEYKNQHQAVSSQPE